MATDATEDSQPKIYLKIKTQTKRVINATDRLVWNINNSIYCNNSCRTKRLSCNVKKVGSWIGSAKRYFSDVQNQVTEITDVSIKEELKKYWNYERG